jgi:hypothetical protein
MLLKGSNVMHRNSGATVMSHHVPLIDVVPDTENVNALRKMKQEVLFIGLTRCAAQARKIHGKTHVSAAHSVNDTVP